MKIIIAEISHRGGKYSDWVSLPCTVEYLKAQVDGTAPSGLYVETIKVDWCDVKITLSPSIYINEGKDVEAMNSFAQTLSNIPGGELVKFVAVLEWERVHTHYRELTWERLEELARDLPNFVHYPRAYNISDVGFTVAHEFGLLKRLPDEVVNNFPYEQLGETHMGDGAFTHYGFVGHWDTVMHDAKNEEE